MLVFVEGGKPENSEKNPQSKARTNNKLNPHMTPGPGFEPGPHWWEASALTTAPTLLPKSDSGLYILSVGLSVLQSVCHSVTGSIAHSILRSVGQLVIQSDSQSLS